MTSHGGGFPTQGPRRPMTARCSGLARSNGWMPGALAVPDVARHACPATAMGSGFRHLLRTPAEDERCRFLIDPQQSAASREARATLSRLVKRMRVGTWAEGAARDNPAIPSGYTYLLELVAHDLVQSSAARSTHPIGGASIENLRRTPLQLGTLYGGGPMVTPGPYAIDDPLLQTRTGFRLGRIGGDGAEPPLRDIARIGGQHLNGEAVAGLSEPLIADPRNDDQAIISQFTVLFQLLHNAVLGLLPTPDNEVAFLEAAAERRFSCARQATTAIYRHIVRRDLLRRLLQPAVYARYDDGGRLLDRQPDGMAAEFSHAAFRVGHAMVRDSYVLNDAAPDGQALDDLLATSSGRAPQRMPLTAEWIVQWSRFFELGSTPPNLSQRIGPQFSTGLNSERMFPHIDETQELGLLYRDMVSAAAAGLWSVAGLLAEIARLAPDPADAALLDTPLLADADRRQAAISQWLGAAPAQGGFGASEVSSLAADPPLAFFVLFEAAHEADGTRLGTLGSIIVAETMFRALGPVAEATLTGQLADISERHFAHNHLASVPDLPDMAALVTYVAKAARLTDAMPAFL